jgi:hypothetical protein
MEKNSKVVHSGKMTHYIPENNVYIYFRHNDQSTVMVILNNSNEVKKSKYKTLQKTFKNTLPEKIF